MEILDLRMDGSIVEAKTKGADQLCLCFQNGKKEFFFHDAAPIITTTCFKVHKTAFIADKQLALITVMISRF